MDDALWLPMALKNVALPNGAEKMADAAAADSVLRTVVEYPAAAAAVASDADVGAAFGDAGEMEGIPTDWPLMETWAGTNGVGGLVLLLRNGSHHHHARRTE